MTRIATVAQFDFPPELRAALKPLMSGGLLRFESAVAPLVKQALQNYMVDVIAEATTSSPLKRRTGAMRAALYSYSRVTGSSLNTLRGVYRGTHYTPLHEYGGTVYPKHETSGDFGPKLAIPLPAAMNPDGSLKIGGPKSWKRFGTFTFVSKKTGQAYLAYKKKTEGNKLVLLFMFVDKATFSAKLGLRKTHKENLAQLANTVGEIMIAAMASTDVYGFATGGTTRLEPRGLRGIVRKTLKRNNIARDRA